jgi:hypothetical protein
MPRSVWAIEPKRRVAEQRGKIRTENEGVCPPAVELHLNTTTLTKSTLCTCFAQGKENRNLDRAICRLLPLSLALPQSSPPRNGLIARRRDDIGIPTSLDDAFRYGSHH